MRAILKKRYNRIRRHARVRRKVEGTSECPRLSVFRSNKHISCQIINDWEGKTLAAASTLSPELREKLKHGGNIAAATAVGELIAAKAKVAGIETVVFDRGPFKFHGRVKALAETARKGGLKF